MTITEYSNRVQKAVGGAETETNAIIEDMKPALVEEQREQMYSGQRSDGEMIEPPYGKMTQVYKCEKGQPYDRVTLKDTGDFYSAIYVENTGTELIFDSSNWKTDDLKDKYGYGIFDLQKSRYDKFKAIWCDRFRQFIIKTINGL